MTSMMMMRKHALYIASTVILLELQVFSADCPGPTIIETNQYFYEMDSPSSGAKGDVVALNLYLNSMLVDPGRIFDLRPLVCHDAELGELVGSPLISEELLEILNYNGVGAGPWRDGSGFGLLAGIQPELFGNRFPSEIPFLMATFYFRIKGNPGAVIDLRFCNTSYPAPGSPEECNINYTYMHAYIMFGPHDFENTLYVSTRNRGTSIRVLDGPPTHPDRPPDPPQAVIYPEKPGLYVFGGEIVMQFDMPSDHSEIIDACGLEWSWRGKKRR